MSDHPEILELLYKEEALNGWTASKGRPITNYLSGFEVPLVRYTDEEAAAIAEEEYLKANPPKLTRGEILAKARDAKKVKGVNNDS